MSFENIFVGCGNDLSTPGQRTLRWNGTLSIYLLGDDGADDGWFYLLISGGVIECHVRGSVLHLGTSLKGFLLVVCCFRGLCLCVLNSLFVS